MGRHFNNYQPVKTVIGDLWAKVGIPALVRVCNADSTPSRLQRDISQHHNKQRWRGT